MSNTKKMFWGLIGDIPVTVSCGQSTQFSGGQSFPYVAEVILGSGTGTVTLTFDAYQVPDKFEVWYDGVKVIDTGYRGLAALQSDFNAELASRGLPPEIITNGGGGTASFVKSTATTTATVKVYGPMESTLWVFTLGCVE